MNKKHFLLGIGEMMVMILVVGCTTPAATSVPSRVASTLAPEPSKVVPTLSPVPPTETPTPTPTPSAPYPKVSNGIYEIQVTEVVTSPLTTGDLVDITVRYKSNDPELALGIGDPSVCGILQDASGSSWAAREIGKVTREGELVHAFCGFLIPITATGLEWIVEGYPSVELGF